MMRGKIPLLFTTPDAPCMDYFPTLGEKWPHSRGNVGQYSRSIEHLGTFIVLYIVPDRKFTVKITSNVTKLAQSQHRGSQI